MRRICCLVLFLMLFAQQALFAGGAEAASKAQITNVRYALRDGGATLRVVFDATGPLDLDATLKGNPTPRLLLDIKGVISGSVRNTLTFNGQIINRISLNNIDSNNGRIVIELPGMISENDYKLFTLPANPQANLPYRVVLDIKKASAPAPAIPAIPVYKFTQGLQNKIIALDPGHGGSDPGAIGVNGTQEKTVTLAIAKNVKTLLEKAGAKVVMTRMDDRDVCAPNASAVDELEARVQVANAGKADIFVSIHINSFSNRSVGGAASYYNQKTPYDSILASSLQDAVVNVSSFSDRGINAARFYVMTHSVMPASLIELGFISNPNEERQLNSSQFQQQLAQGIVNGMENFFAQAASAGGGQ
ncbi:MAG: N-acetylmuramoyl-L-alanine amidase [Pelosinus sp.]|nr:N-acetylmuramoyl-L-alanine amidase [Pelosinus sp.]